MADEFGLIKQYFQPLSQGLSVDETGIGDDGAVLNIVPNHQLVVVTDTLVSGVHFPEETTAYDIGWKALAVNLSDLAAMGARPAFFSLALTLPDSCPEWLSEFAKGLSDLAQLYKVPLVGGDTTKGPLTVTVTAQGWVKHNEAIMRSGAEPNDLVYVTQNIGDAALGLKVALNMFPDISSQSMAEEDRLLVLRALNRPEPQLIAIELLKTFASSAIDISDGLVADLTHIIERSSARSSQALFAEIQLEKIPVSKAVQRVIKEAEDWSMVLFGGDDYQLCFTVNPANQKQAEQFAKEAGVCITQIGEILSSAEVKSSSETAATGSSQRVQVLENKKPFLLKDRKGFLHFD